MICVENIETNKEVDTFAEEYVFPESPNQMHTSVGEDPASVVEDPASVVEDSASVVEEISSVVEDSASAVEEISSAVEDPASAVKKAKKTVINRHGKPWSASEVARLYREYQLNKYTIDKIAEMHGRTYYAIVGKLKTENILYDVEDEEQTYFQEEEEEEDEEDPILTGEMQIHSSFLTFARAYCYVVERVVDVIFGAASVLYGVFVNKKTKNR